MAQDRETNHAQTLPPGHYCLGDPGYIIAGQEWSQYLESWNNGQPFRNRPVTAFFTKSGDGKYTGNDGNTYTVDSGIIGLVPDEAGMPQHEDRCMTRRVQFHQEFTCSQDDDGTLRFGHITIRTGGPKTLAVLIELPSELAGRLEDFLDIQGITMRTQDCLITLNEGHPSRTFLHANELQGIVEKINAHLEACSTVPRVRKYTGAWPLDDRQALLDLALAAFDWDDQLEIECDNFGGDQDSWQEMVHDITGENPQAFTGPPEK